MTATSQGATNRRKGHETERMVVRWLRQVGWPDACTTRAKLGHDGWSAPGDVSFHPLIVLEVKNLTASAWPTWCRQAVAGRTGEAVWSALFGLLGGGFLFAIGWTWHDEGMSE